MVARVYFDTPVPGEKYKVSYFEKEFDTREDIHEFCRGGIWVKDTYYPPSKILKVTILPPAKKSGFLK